MKLRTALVFMAIAILIAGEGVILVMDSCGLPHNKPPLLFAIGFALFGGSSAAIAIFWFLARMQH